jgi:hypothetical protein
MASWRGCIRKAIVADIPVPIPRAPCLAGYFPFGESNQSHCAGHDESTDTLSASLPPVFADRTPAQTPTSM